MRTNKLQVTLPNDTEIHLERRFNFPAELVYRAFADHESHRHWLGCGYGIVTESTGKPEVGAPWHFRMDMGEMGPFHCFGQCLEAVPGERYVRTFIYDAPMIRENPSVESATFTEEDGATVLRVVVRHLCKENRDGHHGSGMEQGASASYDALEDYLAQGSPS